MLKLIPDNKQKCETCNGSGEAAYSCCTGDVVTGDILMCPQCHEWLGEDICETCDGDGYIDEDIEFPDSVDLLTLINKQ